MALISATPFNSCPAGTLLTMLLDVYAPQSGESWYEESIWEQFDDFFYSHQETLDRCGFITRYDDRPVGFISWDPRALPVSVQIGHNCIIRGFQGRGLGIWQLQEALRRIRLLKPQKIIVSTNLTPFFVPARRMYEAAGFQKTRLFSQYQTAVSDMIEYEMAGT